MPSFSFSLIYDCDFLVEWAHFGVVTQQFDPSRRLAVEVDSFLSEEIYP